MAKPSKAKTETVVAAKAAPKAKVQLAAGSMGQAVKEMILASVKIAARNDFAGLKNNGKNGAAISEKDEAGRKAAANKVQPKVSPQGSLTPVLASESGDTYLALARAAVAAGPDLEAKKYSNSVKALYDLVASTSGGGTGARGYNTTGMGDMAARLAASLGKAK